jgi:twitching motility protein PilT
MTGFNHYADCGCGWCVNYGGRSRTNRPQLLADLRQRDAVNVLKSNATRSISGCYVNPNAKCPVCGDAVYFYANGHGSWVFFDDLGLPDVLKMLTQYHNGLILVTGSVGSGKSTTLAAMLDKINSERHEHILTIEDPIEYIHQHKNCLVNQREVHSDTNSFGAALRAALREDPDIVLIGEMRDLETVEAALKIAETGHLTFGTLHTNSAAQTINRIIDVFPAHQQGQIRTQLSLVLEGIVCQALLPKADGKGRVASLEIMIPTPAIRNLIRDDKVHQIYGLMQAGQKHGMQTMNQALFNAVVSKDISTEEAMRRSHDPGELSNMLGQPVGATR